MKISPQKLLIIQCKIEIKFCKFWAVNCTKMRLAGSAGLATAVPQTLQPLLRGKGRRGRKGFGIGKEGKDWD